MVEQSPASNSAPASSLDASINELIAEMGSSGARLAWDDGRFLDWAARLAAEQAAHGSIYRLPPAPLTRLDALAPVTTDIYRYADVRAIPADSNEESAVCFRSSGTLADYRSEHRLWRTDVYDASALAAFDGQIASRFALTGLISLVPPAEQLPDSSLSYMLSLFGSERFAGRTVFAVDADGIDAVRLREGLDELGREQTPLLLFATTLAIADLLELDVEMELPAGSLVLTTGGGKVRRRSLSGDQLGEQLRLRFPDATVGAEYGMTELLSQAYRVGPEPFRLPPWCRVLAIDPELGPELGSAADFAGRHQGGRRQPHGQPGLLRFVDLANAQSAITVQTADLGTTHSDHTFTLLGRAPGAPLRGCSLSFEELTDTEAHGD